MDLAFNPLQLTKEASLNATRLADLPGADPQLVGRQAYAVLRLDALNGLAADYGIQAADRSAGPRRLRAALASSNRAEADAAHRVVAEFGRRLGYLVATLRLGRRNRQRLADRVPAPLAGG